MRKMMQWKVAVDCVGSNCVRVKAVQASKEMKTGRPLHLQTYH